MSKKTEKNRAYQEGKNHEPPWLQELRSRFSQAGIRMTPQRIEIYRLIRDSADHPSAEEVFIRIKEKMPTVSLDTVYRTLSMFEQMGLVRRVHLLSDHARFDPDTSQHHHFVCVRCKRILDFKWPEMDQKRPPAEALGLGKTLFVQAEVRGVCSRCLGLEAPDQEAGHYAVTEHKKKEGPEER